VYNVIELAPPSELRGSVACITEHMAASSTQRTRILLSLSAHVHVGIDSVTLVLQHELCNVTSE